MKRIISIMVAALMIFGVFASSISANAATTIASPENQHATFIAARWHAVGNDKYGDALPNGKSFPWQNAGESLSSYWGRTGYGMPNGILAVNKDGSPKVVSSSNNRIGTSPMLWTEVFLTIIADNGNSKFITNEGGDFVNIGRWYAIMDTAGQVWFDQDGYFHDSRYLPSADPASPSYAYTTSSGTTDWSDDQVPYGSCMINPLAKVDPFEGNNTQGPYAFSPKDSDGNDNPYYVEPLYFWVRPSMTNEANSVEGNSTCNAYLNHTLKGESRVWQLGIASRPDYYAMGRISPLGNTFDGVVREGEWDIGLPVFEFTPDEMWVDVPLVAPWGPGGGSGSFSVGDYLYRDRTIGPANVQPDDVRLTNVVVGISPNTTMYVAGTVVQPTDLDVGLPLNNVPSDFVYAKKDPTKSKTTSTIQARAQHGGVGWSDITAAGTSFIPVDDVSKFTIGSRVRIGPNNLGQFQDCQVTGIVNTTSTAYWRSIYSLQWWGPMAGWWFYTSGCSGTFAPGDYAILATGEVARITNVMNNVWWWTTINVLSFNNNNPMSMSYPYYQIGNRATVQYWNMSARKIQQGLELDCELQYDFSSGTIVEPFGVNPGDFIYRQPGGYHANIAEGDIRYTEVDGHMISGYKMGQGAWEDDALVMAEVFFADPNDPRYQKQINNNDWGRATSESPVTSSTSSTVDTAYGNCMPTYDLSVESDFWQGERVWEYDATTQQWVNRWKGVEPAYTAVALRSPNPDVQPQHERIAKSTVLDKSGSEFFIHTTTIHNVTPDYREYLGLEIFLDNGFDNSINSNSSNQNPKALDLSDNYVRGAVCEPYLGATDRGIDLDFGRTLTVLNGSTDSPMFYDMDGGGIFGCNEPIYFDLDKDGLVSVGDRRCTPITSMIGADNNRVPISYLSGSIIAQGDSDVGTALTQFGTNVKFFDSYHPISRLPSGVYEYGESIYYDLPEPPTYPTGSNTVNAGDTRLSEIAIGPVVYHCGERVGIGDAFYFQYPVYMISLGKNGDYNYMDFPVLPFPKMDVKIEIDKTLKVEQTSHISVSVNPPPKPGESIFVALRDTKIEPRMPVSERQIYQTDGGQADNWLEPGSAYTCDGTINNTHFDHTYRGYYYWPYYYFYPGNNHYYTLPWTFKFYGIDYTVVNCQMMGTIGFGPTSTHQNLVYPTWYEGSYSYGYYGDAARPLNIVGDPRATALGYFWRINQCCWGDAIWPGTGETVFVITWVGSYGPGMYYSYNPPFPEDLKAQMVLFSDGRILMQYKKTNCPSYFYGQYFDLNAYYEVGISNGDGVNYVRYNDNGTCGWGAEGNVMFTPIVIPAKPGIPALNVGEDMKFINTDNDVANFEFTPYRGTCQEDGTRSPVEINLYRDNGGYSDPVPRNPPPQTFMVYREPSYSIMAPNWNGKVIAVQSVFGYLPGDIVLIGTRTNIERRKITEVHVGDEGANTVQSYHSYASSTNLLSKIIPVESVAGFNIGHTVVVGENMEQHATGGPYIQETHIAANVWPIPTTNPAGYARLTSSSNIGTNVSFNVNTTTNYNVGDYIGFGSSSTWWNNNPKRGLESARIVSIAGNTITVDVLHRSVSTGYYIHQINAIETRDPLKFDHYGPGDEPTGSTRSGKGCQVFNTRFSFSLDRGLNNNHIFGDPVVGVLYFDPYYVENKWSRFDLDMYPTRSFANPLSADIMYPDLDNSYDCYYRGRFNIEPEDIKIETYRKCLSVGQLEQRYPNVLLKLWDNDNPNDVNDPADIPISCPAGVTGADQTIIANVNASGCGVAYLMTCDGFQIASPPPLGPVTHRFIVQVNTDGTYEWWRWYEPAAATQIVDALDPNDWLYRWLDDDPDNVIPYQGSPLNLRTSIPQHDNQYGTQLIDNDCSIGGGVCDPVNKDKKWPCLGDVTYNDAYGRFNGVVQDWASAYPNPQNLPSPPYAYGRISHFGVPCAIERWDSSQQRNMQTDGGQIMFPLMPKTSGKISIRVYTYNAIYNYNTASIVGSDEKVSGTPNPGPYFWEDNSLGIDYAGHIDIEVQPADADVNFIEMRMVDHALQNSQLNYTAGVSPIYPMKPPAPRISKDYDPIVRDWRSQVRSYPGGQTFPGLLTGVTEGFGWNAYPAIWTKQFVKLGTEFYPLTDYGLYFILADGTGNHIGVGLPQTPAPANYRDSNREPELCIRRITVTGPFMTPKYYTSDSLNCIIGTRTTPSFEYNNVKGLPIAYDYSGLIEVDMSNYGGYFSFFGGDFSTIWNPLSVDGYAYATTNSWLRKWRDLYYGGFWQVNQTYPNPGHQAGTIDGAAISPNPVEDQQSAIWAFDGLIPISSGEINIEVELQNDVKKTYENCCESAVAGRLRNIPVHGLKIDGAPISVTVDTDNVFDLTVTEDTGVDILDNHEWKNKECNDALVFAWQDKGVFDPSTKLYKGTLDGWITMPPHSSAATNVEHAFATAEDSNGDGKISYTDDETEIIGTYDLVTNTWTGGYIDARTYQRNDGKYKLALTKDNGALIDTIGVDIAGRDANGRPLPRNITDHIIDSDEETPVIVTAYKFGDDNQDHGFTPLYDKDTKYDYSHEVYLAGQAIIPVDARRNLNVTFSPEPLTAGVTPELLGDPLTFTVTNYDGEPVDLSVGVPDANGDRKVIDRSVWYYLFVDPHLDDPLYYGKNARLPQYYWMRTDLHNQQTRVGNYGYNNYNYFSTWNPIEFYPNYAEGKYAFKGFVANDKGDFEVYVYTPDRKNSGVVKVKVALPKVKYEIKNTAKKENIFTTPGDPDFVMTGADNRLYSITVSCSNAQDAILKGVARTVSVCSGEGRDIARFTPALTIPRSYYAGDMVPVYLGIDFNGDQKYTQLSPTQLEYTPFGPFSWSGYLWYYNTFCRQFSDGTYPTRRVWVGNGSWYPGSQGYLWTQGWGWLDFESPPRGIGQQCIYNNIYDGSYIFADITPSGTLDYRDALSLDENGRTSFEIFATDAFNLTGLVGYNEYTNTRYAASALNWNSISNRPLGFAYMRYRYTAGGPSYPVYLMNWEAWADTQLECRIPVVKVYDPETLEEWQKSIYDPEGYDLIYGIRNHMLVRVSPADSRDLPVNEGAAIMYSSFDPADAQTVIPKHEAIVLGRLQAGKDDPNVRETNIFVEPTGTGKVVSGLSFWELYENSRNGMSPVWYQRAFATNVFDVIKGMEIVPEVPENLKTGRETSLTLKVVVAGESKEPVEGAKVTVGGIISEQTGTTNAKGEVTFKVKPIEAGRIVITAVHDTYGKTSYRLGVDTEVAAPLLIVEPIPSYTNKDNVTVKGTTTPGSTVKIAGKPATVDKEGKFTAQVALSEGYNQFDIDAFNPSGMSSTFTMSIIRDTAPPQITCDIDPANTKVFANDGKIYITGRVEPYSKVKVNGADAQVVYDIWSVELSVTTTGDLKLAVEATDPAGNVGNKEITITIWKKDVLTVQINGVNVNVNGNPAIQLPRAVKLVGGVVMVPAELFTTFFNESAPIVDQTNKTATFKIAGKDVVVKAGSKDVMYDSNTLTVGNNVTEDLGVYFLDASSFSDMFNVEYDYNQATGAVTMTRIYK